jgi:hypothetical protein
MKKWLYSNVWILSVALLSVAVALSSCKKEEPAAPGTPPEHPTNVANNEAAPSDDMVPLPIELPPAMFVGTPSNIDVPNLEEPLGKARPPMYAPKGVINVAAGKSIASSDEAPIIGELEYITDGDKAGSDGSYVELGPMVQYVTIDLEQEYEIYAVLAWHYHMQARVYFDVIIQISKDPDFIETTTIFNNDDDNSSGMGVGKDQNYIETSEGKLIEAKGTVGRYVRLYSRGNNQNEYNHYVEVEVFGKPVE